MKIAHIGSRGFPGFSAGVEKSLEEICPRLARRGHAVTVYCSSRVTTPEPIFNGAILKRTPAIETKHLETISRVILSGLDTLFQNYDIVHFHSIGPALMSWLPRLSKSRTVVTVHGLDWRRAKWGRLAKTVLHLGERSAVAFPDQTIVVSEFLKRYYQNRYKKEVVYIPNGVALNHPLPANLIRKKWLLSGKDYIFFVSRLVPEKECHTLIKAYQNLQTDKKLVIAGSSWHSDAYVKELKVLARGNPNILFTGWVDGDLLKELHSNAYLFCLPSQIEGLSLALLEAMSYGVCPLVSDIEENLDVVKENGVAFKTTDAADLSAKLRQLIDDPSYTCQLGLAAKNSVEERYNWDRNCDELERVYFNLLKN